MYAEGRPGALCISGGGRDLTLLAAGGHGLRRASWVPAIQTLHLGTRALGHSGTGQQRVGTGLATVLAAATASQPASQQHQQHQQNETLRRSDFPLLSPIQPCDPPTPSLHLSHPGAAPHPQQPNTHILGLYLQPRRNGHSIARQDDELGEATVSACPSRCCHERAYTVLRLANVAGTQEPIYGPDAIQSVEEQARDAPYTELSKDDLRWVAMDSTCVETQTFYLMADSGHMGLAQVIYSNVA